MREHEAWRRYLDRFHGEHAGITERVLRRCRAAAGPRRRSGGGGDDADVSGIDPYEWLAAQVVGAERVLDLACGSAPLHRELGGVTTYVGLDTSCAELALAAGRGAAVALGDARRLPFAADAVDTVVCSTALMVLPVAETLGEVARVLRPGGCLVATVPASAPLTARDRLAYTRLLMALRIPAFRYPSDAELADVGRACSAAGLRIVHDEGRRFAYRLEPGAEALLLDSLYLPEVRESARRRASRLLAGWTGRELGVPLRLLRMTKVTPPVAAA